MNIVVDEDPGVVHLPHPQGFLTLCGFVDVSYVETDDKVTCKSCLKIMRYCVRVSKGNP